MRRTFYSLRYFNYRLWFFGALVANTGTWMLRTAQSWLVLVELTDGDAMAVGITMALQMGPALFFSPSAGALADRVDRRKLLMLTQSLVGILSLLLGVLALLGHLTLPLAYAITLLSGVVSCFDAPARQTYVSDMVPPRDLPNAVGLNSTSFNIARLIGPAAAGLLIAAIGTGWVFVVTGLLFSGTVVALLLQNTEKLNPIPPAPGGKEARKGMVRDGLRYVRGRSDIVLIMVVVGAVSALGLNFNITSAVMSTEVFGKAASEYGIVGSATAIGSLTGALLAARRERPRVRLVVGAALAFGVATLLAAFAPTFELYVLANIVVGLATLTMLTAANATIQVSTDPQMRGRVMSLYMMVLLGTTPIGSPLVGWISNEFGGRWGLAIGGITAIVAALVAMVWGWRSWGLRFEFARSDLRWGRWPLHLVGPTERLAADEQAQRRADGPL